MTAAVPVAEGLFTWPDQPPHLIGARCESCRTLSFPLGAGCPACGSTQLESTPLEAEGNLWAWTSQDFPPKEPYLGADAPFEPWCVGVIELGGEIRVEARLADCTAADLEIGQRMRTVIIPFARREDGAEVLTFAFAPADAPADEEKSHD